MMNSKCPYCGEHLVADVKVRFDNVPLRDDGYLPEQGDQVWSELLHIRCPSCGHEVSSGYYHGCKSKLKSAVRAAAAKGEEDG